MTDERLRELQRLCDHWLQCEIAEPIDVSSEMACELVLEIVRLRAENDHLRTIEAAAINFVKVNSGKWYPRKGADFDAALYALSKTIAGREHK